jgi:uncharacterized protein DUF4129
MSIQSQLSKRVVSTLSMAGLAVGLLILAWVTAGGSALGWHHPKATPRTAPTTGEPVTSCPTGKVRSVQGNCVSEHRLQIDGAAVVIGWVLQIVGIACVIALIWFIYVSRPRPREREELPEDPDPFSALPSVAEAITEDADLQFAALREGSPRNAIVACWIRLEQSVEKAGLDVRPGETSTELTVRAIRRYTLDRSSIATLAKLYREARFSTHPISEDMRVAAINVLERLHDDLLATTVKDSP